MRTLLAIVILVAYCAPTFCVAAETASHKPVKPHTPVKPKSADGKGPRDMIN